MKARSTSTTSTGAGDRLIVNKAKAEVIIPSTEAKIEEPNQTYIPTSTLNSGVTCPPAFSSLT
jgi:formylmethanofuran dehydrogenase subunit D